MIIDFKKNDNLDQIISKYNKVIIDVYATWCGPCKMLAPQLEEFAKNHNDWALVKMDADQHPEVGQMFNVQAVPTMVLIVNKKVVQTIVGFKPLSEIEKITGKY